MSIRILQVGAGIRGRHWTQFVKEHPGTSCVALVDPVEASREQARAVLGETCRYFATLEEALAAVEADAALITSPDRLHAEHAMRCLEAGLTVMIEKPFTPTVAEAAAVLDKARQTGLQVLVAEQYRFWPAERTVRRLLEKGLIGRVDHATLVDRRAMPARTEGPWMAELDHPQLQDIAVHHFDSLRMWFGRPTAISARTWNAPWSDYRSGSNTEATMTFGDVHVQYVGTLRSHRFGCSLWIEGEKGVIWTNRKYVAHRPAGSRWFRPVRNVKVPKGDDAPYPKGGTVSLLDSLCAAVREGRPAETHGADNIWSIAILEAGRIADKERREVAIAEVGDGTWVPKASG
ncbi:Gfo/Idh/MocA family oxidoreductase [Geminicoccaceae bacterium 1502E]|nr:Gfo/Idh/MocA family oxidoreductase [Geminicoccaceae bacterium 1502E]